MVVVGGGFSLIGLVMVLIGMKQRKEQQIISTMTTNLDRNIREDSGEVLYSIDETNSAGAFKQPMASANSMLFEEDEEV